MLPKLSERAAMRATAHIRRYYPDWRQSRILDSGSESDQLRMDEFISSCKDHLAKLRNQIADGETPCIDTKWPEPIDNRVELGTNDEGLIIVEKIVQDPALTEALEETKRKLDEALASRGEGEPEPIEANYDEPPAEIADLIDPDLTARQNLDVLIQKRTAAKHLEEMARSHGDMDEAMKHLKDVERFETGIKWNRAVLVEVV